MTPKTSQELYQDFLHNKLSKENGEIFGSSDNGIKNFLGSTTERQQEILDSTKISITEEEFDFARKFLALIYITGGEHFTKDGVPKNHKDVYQNKEILPENFGEAVEDSLRETDKTLKEKIDIVSEEITAEQVNRLYQRLVKERPTYFYGYDDEQPRQRQHNFDLENYISYSEMGLSAMIQVAGQTNFINDGDRENRGHISTKGDHEEKGHIAGLIGPRVEITNAMEPLQLVSGLQQKQKEEFTRGLRDKDKADFGRIKSVNQQFVDGHELIWDEFYKNKIRSGQEGKLIEQRLKHRLYISYKKLLAYAVENSSIDKKAYIRVSGIGDGCWCRGKVGYAEEIGKAVGGAFAQALTELSEDQRNKIDTVHFSQHFHDNYQKGFDEFFKDDNSETILRELEYRNIVGYGGIKVTKSTRVAPFSSKLPPEASGMQLITIYAWDGGSLPGNEFYHGKPAMSGDPAAACCSSIGFSQNPETNPNLTTTIQVVKKDYSLTPLATLAPTKKIKKDLVPVPVLASSGASLGVDTSVHEDGKRMQEMQQTLNSLFSPENITKIESANEFYINYKVSYSADFDNAFRQASDTINDLYDRFEIKGGEGREKKSVVAHVDEKVDYYGSREALKTKSNLHSVGILLTFDNVSQITRKLEEEKKLKQDAEDFKELVKNKASIDISLDPESYTTMGYGVSLGTDKVLALEIIDNLFEELEIGSDAFNKKTLIAVNKESGAYCYDDSLDQSQIKEYRIILSEGNKKIIQGALNGDPIDLAFKEVFDKIKAAQVAQKLDVKKEDPRQLDEQKENPLDPPQQNPQQKDLPNEDPLKKDPPQQNPPQQNPPQQNPQQKDLPNEDPLKKDPPQIQSTDTNQNSEFWNNAKPWVGAGVAGGVAFGGALLCASALGFAVVSVPVIVPAVIVGGAVAVVAFQIAKNSQTQE